MQPNRFGFCVAAAAATAATLLACQDRVVGRACKDDDACPRPYRCKALKCAEPPATTLAISATPRAARLGTAVDIEVRASGWTLADPPTVSFRREGADEIPAPFVEGEAGVYRYAYTVGGTPAPAEGAWTVRASGTDSRGEEISAEDQVVFDFTPPAYNAVSTTFVRRPARKTDLLVGGPGATEPGALVEAFADDAATGAALGKAAAGDRVGSFSLELGGPKLATVWGRAVDPAGNASAAAPPGRFAATLTFGGKSGTAPDPVPSRAFHGSGLFAERPPAQVEGYTELHLAEYEKLDGEDGDAIEVTAAPTLPDAPLMTVPPAPPRSIEGNPHTAAYDPRRGRVVFLDWETGITWEFDGARWEPLPWPQELGLPHLAALAFDSTRGHMVLTGGEDCGAGTCPEHPVADTWEYDGRRWTHAGAGLAKTRSFPTMAYEPSRERMVLFGGLAHSGLCDTDPDGGCPCDLNGYCHDTWVREKQSSGDYTWRMLTKDFPGLVLGGDTWAAAYMPSLDAVVVAEGTGIRPDGSTPPVDLYKLGESSWTHIDVTCDATHTCPGARSAFSIAYDDADDALYLCCGRGRQTNLDGAEEYQLNDLWRFDGARWTQVLRHGAAGSPAGRWFPMLVGDPLEGRLVLWNGLGPQPVDADVWQWKDGWSRVALGGAGFPSSGAPPFAYDPERDAVVAVGRGPGPASLTYEWREGRGWAAVGISPARYSESRIAYDPRLKKTVLASDDMDVWLWDGHDWEARVPAAYPSNAPRYSPAAYHAPLQAVCIFGGFDWTNYDFLNDLWCWDDAGSTWVHVDYLPGPPDQPAHRDEFGFTGSLADGSLLVHGGYDWNYDWTDLWTLRGTPPSGPWTFTKADPDPPEDFALVAYDQARKVGVFHKKTDLRAEFLEVRDPPPTPAVYAAGHGYPAYLARTAPAIYDWKRGRIRFYDPQREAFYDTWAGTRARLLVAFDLAAEQVGALDSLTVKARLGGAGESEGTAAGAGAELAIWNARAGRWTRLAEVAAPYFAPATAEAVLGAELLGSPSPLVEDGKLYLLLSSAYPALGTAAVLAVDAVEVQIGYRAP